MIDKESIEDLREAEQICEDFVQDMYLIDDDNDVPAFAADVEDCLSGAAEQIREAIVLLKRS